MLKIIALFAALSIIGMMVFTSSAHNSSSSGTLGLIVTWGNKSSISFYPEGNHLNGTSFTYRIASSSHMTTSVTNAIINGASSWSPEISISRVTSGGLGTVQFSPSNFFKPNEPARAAVQQNTSNHVTTYIIHLNPNATITDKIMAHEFGHIIGLDDLGDPDRQPSESDLMRNHTRWKIMWYGDNTFAAGPGPTVRDRIGARLITGQLRCNHSNISPRYYTQKSTSSNGVVRNMHRPNCGTCWGYQLGSVAAACNGGAQCLVCGTNRNGDANRDGRITMDDVQAILSFAAGASSPITTPTAFYIADVNGNGRVEQADALEIMKFLAGNPSMVG